MQIFDIVCHFHLLNIFTSIRNTFFLTYTKPSLTPIADKMYKAYIFWILIDSYRLILFVLHFGCIAPFVIFVFSGLGKNFRDPTHSSKDWRGNLSDKFLRPLLILFVNLLHPWFQYIPVTKYLTLLFCIWLTGFLRCPIHQILVK